MAQVSYRCPRCDRTIESDEGRVLDLLRRRRTRCQVCGAQLEFPSELLASAEPQPAPAAVRADERLEYGCRGCGARMRTPRDELVERARRGRARCQRCGGELELPPEVVAVLGELDARGALPKKVEVACPACTRRARADVRQGEQVLACSYCGARFRPPREPGGPPRPPPLEAPAASPAELAPVLARAPKDALAQVAAQALAARGARGEVTLAEAVTLVARLAALAGWRPRGDEDPPRLPLPLAEAQRVVPWLLFPGLPWNPDRRPGAVDLVFETGSAGTEDRGAVTAALSILAAPHLLGAGLLVPEPDRERQRRLRVTLEQAGDDGVTLSLAAQVDDGAPSPAGGRAHVALSRTIHERAGALRSYFALLAVLGPGCEGTAAANATEEAIGARLVDLGGLLGAKAPALAERLRVAR